MYSLPGHYLSGVLENRRAFSVFKGCYCSARYARCLHASARQFENSTRSNSISIASCHGRSSGRRTASCRAASTSAQVCKEAFTYHLMQIYLTTLDFRAPLWCSGLTRSMQYWVYFSSKSQTWYTERMFRTLCFNAAKSIRNVDFDFLAVQSRPHRCYILSGSQSEPPIFPAGQCGCCGGSTASTFRGDPEKDNGPAHLQGEREPAED